MKIFAHFKKNRELYLYAPLSVLLIFGAVLLYRVLTGRAPLDDLSALPGLALNFLVVVLAIVATGFIKGLILTDLSDEETKTLAWWRVWLDSLETLVVFSLVLWRLSH